MGRRHSTSTTATTNLTISLYHTRLGIFALPWTRTFIGRSLHLHLLPKPRRPASISSFRLNLKNLLSSSPATILWDLTRCTTSRSRSTNHHILQPPVPPTTILQAVVVRRGHVHGSMLHSSITLCGGSLRLFVWTYATSSKLKDVSCVGANRFPTLAAVVESDSSEESREFAAISWFGVRPPIGAVLDCSRLEEAFEVAAATGNSFSHAGLTVSKDEVGPATLLEMPDLQGLGAPFDRQGEDKINALITPPLQDFEKSIGMPTVHAILGVSGPTDAIFVGPHFGASVDGPFTPKKLGAFFLE